MHEMVVCSTHVTYHSIRWNERETKSVHIRARLGQKIGLDILVQAAPAAAVSLPVGQLVRAGILWTNKKK